MKSLLRILGLGFLGYVLAYITSISAPTEIARELKIWMVAFFVVIAIIIDIAEFAYKAGKRAGQAENYKNKL